jgi:surfactin synthase thioesterase subunit
VTKCAEDLLEIVEDPFADFSVPTILSAHSFGGKVALRFLESLHASGQDLPLHTWILDSIPGPYDINKQQNDGQSVVRVLKALATLPKTFESREWVIKEIVKSVSNRTLPLSTTPLLCFVEHVVL